MGSREGRIGQDGRTDGVHVSHGQLRSRILGSCVRNARATLADHVDDVVSPCTQKEMIDVAASWPVTGMQHTELRRLYRDRTMVVHPNGYMRELNSARGYVAVATSV
jgi:hypothetical protein